MRRRLSCGAFEDLSQYEVDEESSGEFENVTCKLALHSSHSLLR